MHEKKEDKVGFGILPILQAVHPDPNIEHHPWPTREAVGAELTAFMRKTFLHDAVTRSKEWGIPLQQVYDSNNAPAKCKILTLKQIWPSLVSKGKSNKGNEPWLINERFGQGGTYSEKKLEELGVKRDKVELATRLANCSLASTTWRLQSSIEKVWMRCAQDWDIDLSFPWSVGKCLNFITWMKETGKSASTARQYLSGVKQEHKRKRKDTEAFDSFMVKTLLGGFDNLDSDPKSSRIPITPQIMRVLKTNIFNTDWPRYNKHIIWLLAVLMFHGALRSSDILSDKVDTITEGRTMKWEDLRVEEEAVEGMKLRIVKMRVKAPKNLKSMKSVEVELLENGGFMCPVKTLERMKRYMSRKEGLKQEDPVAKWRQNKLITKRKFNELLRSLLASHIDYGNKRISSHSFRSGIVSTLATLGYNDEELRRVGRWASDCMSTYAKHGKLQRREEMLKISKEISRVANIPFKK